MVVLFGCLFSPYDEGRLRGPYQHKRGRSATVCSSAFDWQRKLRCLLVHPYGDSSFNQNTQCQSAIIELSKYERFKEKTMLLNSTPISDLQDLLDAHGLHAGLMFLNARVPHRYTAVYQLSDEYLRRLAFVDKEGGSGEATATVPFKDSFCELAVRQGHLFVSDFSADARLRDQPNSFLLGSYIGLPLATTGSGALYGTLCHYDTRAHTLSDAELVFMKQASEILTRFCLRLGMPVHAPTTA